ncbi:MAG TPA: hypothetical protein VFR37_03335 [Longimicrobium sp.]|nr:hypothetical protein [Longimicrobium sp.]
MASTNVLVRVQAKGGKFLGPDAGYSRVTLTDTGSGTVLAQGIAEGGSGTLTGGFVAAATRQQIVTPQFGTQTTLWLSATPGQPTAGLSASVDLPAPTMVELAAEALTDGVPNGHTVRQTMWLAPGADLTAEPGVVLVMPGLIVDILVPATQSLPDRNLDVSAWVTMMCGCQIDPTLPWVPSDFQVTATISQIGGSFTTTVPLTFQTTSTFDTADPIALPGPGSYDLTVNAVQAAEGNVGSEHMTFTVPG